MELSAGPTNPYLPSTTTNYPIPQSNSSTTPLAPLPFYGSSMPPLPSNTTQQQLRPSPHQTKQPTPLDLHVNAPQGNVWVNDPLVMSDGSAPVNSTSEDHARSAAMVLDASSLDTLQPPASHPTPHQPLSSLDSAQPISSENPTQTPEELLLEKLSLGSKSPNTKPTISTEGAQTTNPQFRRTSHNLPNRSPRKFKDYDSNHGHVSNKFGSQDHQKFNSASSPISPGLANSLAFSNGPTGTTVGSRDHPHRKYSSSHSSSQQNSHKPFNVPGRLSNGVNKNQTNGRHGGWKNNSNNNNPNNLHHSSGSTMKSRSPNAGHNDRHPPSHHSSRAPRTSLRSNEEYPSAWYPPPAPSLDGSYPAPITYNKYGGMEYGQPPAHPYGGSTYYPPPTYRTDSTPSNPDPNNPGGVVPTSGAMINVSTGVAGATGPIGHHPNQPPRFHIPSSSPTTAPYGPNPLTTYPTSAPPEPHPAYPPGSEHYYGMPNYYQSQYYYPPPFQQQQPPSTAPFSPTGQPEMVPNMLSPTSVVSYGENVNDLQDRSPGYLQQQQPYYPTYPTYPAPVTQLPYALDSVRYYILGQCEYYFSSDNLVKDMFLRNCMDGEGWVSISIIGRFNRIKSLTDDVKLVTEVMKMSGVLEVDDQRMVVRRRGDWDHWLLSSSQKDPQVPGERLAEPKSSDHQQQESKEKDSSSGAKVESESVSKATDEEDNISTTTLSREGPADSTQDAPSDINASVPLISQTEKEDHRSCSSSKGSQLGKEEANLLGGDGSSSDSLQNQSQREAKVMDDSLVIVTPGISKKKKKGGTSHLQPTISIGFDPKEVKKSSSSISSSSSSNKNRSHKSIARSVDERSIEGRASSHHSNSNTAASCSDQCSINSASDLK